MGMIGALVETAVGAGVWLAGYATGRLDRAALRARHVRRATTDDLAAWQGLGHVRILREEERR